MRPSLLLTQTVHTSFGRPYKVGEVIIWLESLQVIGVLHDKYLFKTRPQPLISKPDSARKHWGSAAALLGTAEVTESAVRLLLH